MTENTSTFPHFGIYFDASFCSFDNFESLQSKFSFGIKPEKICFLRLLQINAMFFIDSPCK